MTIMLSPQTEARLREKAQRESADINAVAEALIEAALEWEARERAEAIAGVQQGEQAAREGRERPLEQIIAEQRIRHGFSPLWPDEPTDTQKTCNAA